MWYSNATNIIGSDYVAENRDKKPRFTEDGFDMERTKRGMSAIASAKRRNKKANWQLRIGRAVLMVVSLGVFLLLFFLAMEVITLFY